MTSIQSSLSSLRAKVLHHLKQWYYRKANPLGEQIVRQNLTYLSLGALYNIHAAVKTIEKQGVKGQFIEAGCALGGSTIQIGKSKSTDRVLKVYDVFGMIPPPSPKDGTAVQQRYEEIESGASKGIRGETYYGYETHLLEKVKQHLRQFGLSEEDHIHLIQGLYEDTLFPDSPIAFAHIDCDWYESVRTCLERITPHLSDGGLIVMDDYFDWEGCKTAVDEYFSAHHYQQTFTFREKSRKLYIYKNQSA